VPVDQVEHVLILIDMGLLREHSARLAAPRSSGSRGSPAAFPVQSMYRRLSLTMVSPSS
jgi:hypothetical protein